MRCEFNVVAHVDQCLRRDAGGDGGEQASRRDTRNARSREHCVSASSAEGCSCKACVLSTVTRLGDKLDSHSPREDDCSVYLETKSDPSRQNRPVHILQGDTRDGNKTGSVYPCAHMTKWSASSSSALVQCSTSENGNLPLLV